MAKSRLQNAECELVFASESSKTHAKPRQGESSEWPDDQAIVCFSREVLVNHYERRDLDAVLRAVVPDLTWVGPLDNMHAHTAEDMRRIIEPEYGTRVRIVNEDWGIRTVGDARVVLGRFGLVAEGTEVEEVMFRQAATFVWSLTSVGPRVVHLHLSNSYDVPSRVEAPFEQGEDGIAYTIDACTAPVTAKRARIRFEMGDAEIRYVAEDRIVSLFVDGRGSRARTDEGSFHVVERLVEIEACLPDWFVRTHRGCIVNAHRALGVRRFAVDMDDGSECPIAERRYLEVADAIDCATKHPLPRS